MPNCIIPLIVIAIVVLVALYFLSKNDLITGDQNEGGTEGFHLHGKYGWPYPSRLTGKVYNYGYPYAYYGHPSNYPYNYGYNYGYNYSPYNYYSSYGYGY